MEQDTNTNNKRIAKNTMFLYIRMGLSMIVSLYTSRVIIQALGVVDYGIYGLVGGIVAMFSFLNATMSGATSRFLTYELGRGDSLRLKQTFNMAFYEHLIIAVVLIIICETFGLWFLNNKLVIPDERLFAAKCVYQLSILSMAVSVTQVPYSASIVAHEKMSIYAYVELANVVLRLLIVFLLELFMFDKLILYAVLVFVASLSIMIYYRYYCIKHFEECHLQLYWNSSILKSMLSFSGWDLYGNLSTIARTQGVNMLLNMFFGPVLNAASSIATQVQAAVMGFATNALMATKPQIIKYYAQESYKEMIHLISNAIRLNYLILMFVSIPLIIELHYVLNLWLEEVPEYTVAFCALTLLFNFYANMSTVLVTGIHATGKIIRPSLINGTLYLSVVPITYIAFKHGVSPWFPYLFNVLAVIIGMLSNAYTMKLYVKEFSFRKFFIKDFIPCVSVFIVTFGCCYLFTKFFEEGFLRLLATTLLSTSILLIMGYYFIIPRSLSLKVTNNIKSKLCKKV